MIQLFLIFILTFSQLNAYQYDPYENFAYETSSIYQKDNVGSAQSLQAFNDTTLGAFYNNGTNITLIKLSHSGEELASLTTPNTFNYKQTLLSNATIYWDTPVDNDPFVIIPGQSSTNSDTALLLKYNFNKNSHFISLDTTFGTNGTASLTINGTTVAFWCVVCDENYYYAAGSAGSNGVLARFTKNGILDTTFNAIGYIIYDGNNGTTNSLATIYDFVALQNFFILHTINGRFLSVNKQTPKSRHFLSNFNTITGFSKMHPYGNDSFFIADNNQILKFNTDTQLDLTFNDNVTGGALVFHVDDFNMENTLIHSIQIINHYLFAIGEYTTNNQYFNPFVACYDITSLNSPMLSTLFSPTGYITYTWSNNPSSHGAVTSIINDSTAPLFFIAGEKYIRYIKLPSNFYSNIISNYFHHRLDLLNSQGFRIP